MDKKNYSSLVKTVEKLTHTEMCLAPELPTLIALDANLLETMRILEFQNPALWSKNRNIANGVEEHIAYSILMLAKALRRNLSVYYAAIRENNQSYYKQQEISF